MAHLHNISNRQRQSSWMGDCSATPGAADMGSVTDAALRHLDSTYLGPNW